MTRAKLVAAVGLVSCVAYAGTLASAPAEDVRSANQSTLAALEEELKVTAADYWNAEPSSEDD